MMSVRLRIVRSISLVLLTLALVLALIANNIPDDRRQTAPRIKPSTSSSTQSLIPYSKVPGNKCFAIFLIYSAPQYRNRREAVRNSWLEWLDPNQQHCYRFITHTKRNATSVKSNENDLTVLDGPDGRLQYGKRGLDLLRFGEQHFTSGYSYLVKLDDDGFLCLPRLLYQLKRRPRQRFVWGKYWLQNQWGRNRGRTRMDENFMVISRDLVQFIVLNTGSSDSLLAFDPTQTFAVNFAYWTHFLRLNIHDDRSEIDSQQHYLTSYMRRSVDEGMRRNGTYQNFCRSFVYAHHVPVDTMVAAYHPSLPSALNNQQLPAIQRPPSERYFFDTQAFRSLSSSSNLRLAKCACSSLPV